MASSGRNLANCSCRMVILALFGFFAFSVSGAEAAPTRKEGRLLILRIVQGEVRLRAFFRSTGRAPTRVGLRFSSERSVLDYTLRARRLNPVRRKGRRVAVSLRKSLLAPGAYTFQARALAPLPSSWTDAISLTLEDEDDPIIISSAGAPGTPSVGELPPLPLLAGQSECPSNYAGEILAELNRQRTLHGLPEFAVQRQLAWSARWQAIENGERHLLTHDGWFDKILASGALQAGLKRFGQNVWNYIQDPYHAVRALMESPGHRANILRPEYSHVGIGCIVDSRGVLYGAQNFGG